MDKYNQAQDYAIRVFTDVLEHMYREPKFPAAIRSILGPDSPVGLGSKGRCRSFVLFQPKQSFTDAEVENMFHGRFDNKAVLSRLTARLQASYGYGLPIELLGHGRPGFELHAITKPMEEGMANMEKRIIDAYEHPIIPLPAVAYDCFAQERDWLRDTMRELTAMCKTAGLVVDAPIPADSNSRVTLFVYDYYTALSRSDLANQIVGMCRDKLMTNKVTFCKYGWSIACVFILE